MMCRAKQLVQRSEAGQTHAFFKTGEAQFVSTNRPKTRKRNRQGMSVKDRNADQSQCKENEVEWNSKGWKLFAQGDLNCNKRQFPVRRSKKSKVALKTNGHAAMFASLIGRSCHGRTRSGFSPTAEMIGHPRITKTLLRRFDSRWRTT